VEHRLRPTAGRCRDGPSSGRRGCSRASGSRWLSSWIHGDETRKLRQHATPVEAAKFAIERGRRLSSRERASVALQPPSGTPRSSLSRREIHGPWFRTWLQLWLQLCTFALVRQRPRSYERARQVGYGTIANCRERDHDGLAVWGSGVRVPQLHPSGQAGLRFGQRPSS
jgi:hypothetical protein